MERVEGIQQEMQDYLAEQRRLLKSSTVNYKDIGNEKFQIEIPIKVKPPQGYIFKSSTKVS